MFLTIGQKVRALRTWMRCSIRHRHVSEPYTGCSATNGYGGITLEARLSGSRSGAPRSRGASARFAEAVVQRVRMRSHLFARDLEIARASRRHAGERKIDRAASMWMRLDARRSPRSRRVILHSTLHFRRSNSGHASSAREGWGLAVDRRLPSLPQRRTRTAY